MYFLFNIKRLTLRIHAGMKITTTAKKKKKNFWNIGNLFNLWSYKLSILFFIFFRWFCHLIWVNIIRLLSLTVCSKHQIEEPLKNQMRLTFNYLCQLMIFFNKVYERWRLLFCPAHRIHQWFETKLFFKEIHVCGF